MLLSRPIRYGLYVSTVGTFADPRVTVEVARTAEAAGWEALIVWDHLGFVWEQPAADPWTVLAAVAASTSTIRIGTGVTPVPRRRPQTLAHQVATLDVLSGGRVIFGAAIGGVAREFSAFGEPDDPRLRAEKLDEGLDVLRRLWSGETVMHHGAHYTVDGIRLAPTPVRESVPIWIGGNSPPALRRAARFDGWFPDTADEHGMTFAPEELGAGIETIRAHRKKSAPFDVAVFGYSDPGETTLRAAYAEGGATWWLEYLRDPRGTLDEMLARVAAGP